MEGISQSSVGEINRDTKQYLYHMVPEDMNPNEEGKQVLYPLNMLKEKFPELYEMKAKKYSNSEDKKRQSIPEQIIPTLEHAAWGDVIQLTAIRPEDLKKALIEAGFNPKELKFYQVDPMLLDPEKTTIYLYREELEDENPENFTKYDPENLREYAVVPEGTKEYYKKVSETNKQVAVSETKRPLLFVGVPHIFHKGSIDVSNFPVITV